jgi:hypothetical protein
MQGVGGGDAAGGSKPTVTPVGDHTVLIESFPVVALATYDAAGDLNFVGVGLEPGPGLTPVLVTDEPLAHWLEADAQLAFHNWFIA